MRRKSPVQCFAGQATVLSKRDQKRFLEILHDDRQPSAKLRKAAKRYRRAVAARKSERYHPL